MSEFETERALLREVRDRLDGWLYEAREQAFAEVFEGDDAILGEEELRSLDRIDSALTRERGRGVWNSDDYGIVRTGTLDEETTPRVVCTSHPRLPEYATREIGGLDDETRRRLNDALWEYSERVVEHAQQRLEEFVWSADVDTWSD